MSAERFEIGLGDGLKLAGLMNGYISMSERYAEDKGDMLKHNGFLKS